MPSISIVLPTFTRISRIKKCLPSFLATELTDVEFIVVDNRSTDGTWEYLQTLSLQDKRVKTFRNSQNVGAVKSIFRAYCEVQSPFVIFLADDDLMVGDYISACFDIFRRHPNVAMIHHLFDGWQNLPQRFEKKYAIFSKGSDAVRQIFMKSGSYPGIAWRMSALDLLHFPLDQGVIYLQVKVSLEIASKFSVAIVNHCGLIAVDFGDNAFEVKEVQNRPDDFGIGERLFYANQVGSSYLFQELAFQISGWALGVYETLLTENYYEAKKFNIALVKSLHSSSPILIFRLMKEGHWRAGFQAIIVTVLNLNFFKNYLYFFGFAVSKLIRRIS